MTKQEWIAVGIAGGIIVAAFLIQIESNTIVTASAGLPIARGTMAMIWK